MQKDDERLATALTPDWNDSGVVFQNCSFCTRARDILACPYCNHGRQVGEKRVVQKIKKNPSRKKILDENFFAHYSKKLEVIYVAWNGTYGQKFYERGRKS